MLAGEDLTKAVLYCWPSSFLSMVPRLVMLEKGYHEDEYTVLHVDPSMGETFSPSFLSVNTMGTIPTLVVPTIEAIEGRKGKNVTKTHTLCGARSIVKFLDQARTPYNTGPGDGRPPPMLSPSSHSEKALTESFIRLVSSPQVDPNFLELSARDRAELYEKRKAQQGHMLSSRQVAIERYLAEAKARVPNPPAQPRSTSPTREERLVELLTQKAASNSELLAIYNGEADDERRQQFIDSSVEAWCVHLPTAIRKLEALMVGPFALGDDLSIADAYIVVWLARLVTMCGGDGSCAGLRMLERNLQGYPLGNKLHNYWGHWVQRTSFRAIALMPP